MSIIGRKKMMLVRNRERRKKYGEREDYDRDGSRMSRDMANQRLSLAGAKIRAEKKDPFTTHPLSFEEFDNIPDIGEIPVEETE